jgi:uncharacterized protein YjeT (DUF2065 family)
MSDLAVGLGLVLVLEGLLWALVPGIARKLLEAATSVPEQTLRLAGASAVALGVWVVWMVRG